MGTTERDGKSLAWRLESNPDHLSELPDVRHDLSGWHTPVGEDYYCLLNYTRELDISIPVTFSALSDAVFYTAYPHNDLMWPIMSKNMLEVLYSAGEFPHHLFPIQVTQAGAVIDQLEFFGVQLLSHQDYFDWENSVYDRQRSSQRRVAGVEVFVLAIPEEGLPPIFRLSAVPTYLFVSDEARQALKEAGIRGPRYLPLDGFISQVDLPVLIPTCS